jgi:hypothetical protein
VIDNEKGQAMAEVRVTVREGVWIDEEWLRTAGLGRHLQIEVQPGEIRISDLPTEEVSAAPSARGWETFRDMGRKAQPGKLRNASVDHDRYLYGKSK